MAKIVLNHVSKAFKEGQLKALKDISLEAADGEFFCLLGPAGAGKTTTIKLIAGNEAVDKGSILLGDQDVTNLEAKDRDVAVAYETYALYPHLTVRENLAFPLEAPLRKKEYTADAKNSRVVEIAEMLGIGELLSRFPRQLSGGQRQRVALGRALVRKPKAYLLDEPIAHLDAKLRHRMRGELKRIQMGFGITMLYTTPDQLEALSLADHMAVLNAGVIEQVGTPDDIYNHPINTFVARFVGDPPMNLLDSKIEFGNLVISEIMKLPAGEALEGLLASGDHSRGIRVGIRPKDLTLTSPGAAGNLANAVVEHIQILGETAIVGVKTDATTLRAKVATDRKPAAGEQVGITFRREDCHFFDAQSEMRLEQH